MESRSQLIEKYLAGLLQSGVSKERIDAARRRLETYRVPSTTTSSSTTFSSTDSTSYTEYSTSSTLYSTSTATTTEVPTTLESTPLVEYIGYIEDVTSKIGERISEVGHKIAENVTQIVQQLTENVTVSTVNFAENSTVSGVPPLAELASNSTTVQWETSLSTEMTSTVQLTQVPEMDAHPQDGCTESNLQSGFTKLLSGWVEYWTSTWSQGEGANGSLVLPATDLEVFSTDNQAEQEWEVRLDVQNRTADGPGPQLFPEGVPSTLTWILLGATLAGSVALKNRKNPHNSTPTVCCFLPATTTLSFP